MSNPKLSLALAAIVALFAPSAVLAQHGMPPTGAPGGADPKAQAMMMAQMRIMQAQQKALTDPAIIKERDAIQATIEAEMKKRDPQVGAKIERFHVLEKQLEGFKAQGPEGRAKAEPVIKEIRELAKVLFEHQQKAMENAAVKAKVEAFDKKVQAKMAEIDPGVPPLIEQMKASQPMPPPGH